MLKILIFYANNLQIMFDQKEGYWKTFFHEVKEGNLNKGNNGKIKKDGYFSGERTSHRFMMFERVAIA